MQLEEMVCIRRRCLRKNLHYILFVVVLCLIIYLKFLRSKELDIRDRESQMLEILRNVKAGGDYACKLPELPVNAPEIMRFLKNVSNIDCSGAGIDWAGCKGHYCSIQKEATAKFGQINCTYNELIRVDDFSYSWGKSTTTSAPYKLVKSDTVKVSCVSYNSNDKWKSILIGVRYDEAVQQRIGWDYVPSKALRLNVLIFGFDSMSRNMYIRKLPKTYKYLSEVLNAFILKGYNIVGDGTPQALIPILTGRSELELPDARHRYPNTQYVNVFPFIWKDFRKAGYVTSFMEDDPVYSTFTYRLRGFDDPPTDHYMRSFYLAARQESRRSPEFCIGSIPKHKIMLDFIKQYFSVYKDKPKFLFGFHGELSHDSFNLIGAADDDVVELLKDLHQGGTLNNTLLIFMADHGHRFTEIRDTVQGKQEERNPFFSFAFPPWFKEKYRDAYDNFSKNVDRLTTPFDIYSTLRQVLHFGDSDDSDVNQFFKDRSLSLFSEISETRSCADAFIEPHWCACLDWQSISLTDPITSRLESALLTTLNNYTRSQRRLCSELTSKKIEWVNRARPNDNLLKFYKNADIDGFKPDLTGQTAVTSVVYQIKLVAEPGGGIFEASITHWVKEDTMRLRMEDISRINKYGRQARCIEEEFPHLRKYCYCKE